MTERTPISTPALPGGLPYNATQIGFSQATIGAAGSVAAKLQQIISVKDAPYNAVGDGVTDDTAAFAAAIAALGSSGGRITCPVGTYITNITMPDYPKEVQLIGAGRGYTILQSALTNTPVIKGAVNLITNDATGRDFISGFTLKAHPSGSTGAALDLQNYSFSKVQNIGFAANGTGKWTYGILLDATSHCYGNEIDDVSIKNENPITTAVVRLQTHPNLQFLSRFEVTACNVPMVFSFDNSGIHHIRITDGHFEGLTSVSPAVIDPGNSNSSIWVDHCYFENVVDAITRTSTSYVALTDNWFSASPGASIAGAWPKNFGSLNNGISGGQFARNRLIGSFEVSGAPNAENAYAIFWNSAGTTQVRLDFNGNMVMTDGSGDAYQLIPGTVGNGITRRSLNNVLSDFAPISETFSTYNARYRTGAGTSALTYQIDTSGQFNLYKRLYLAQDTGTTQTSCGIFAGVGAPNNANGANGDIYFRSDGGALTTIYQRRTGAWVGIV